MVGNAIFTTRTLVCAQCSCYVCNACVGVCLCDPYSSMLSSLFVYVCDFFCLVFFCFVLCEVFFYVPLFIIVLSFLVSVRFHFRAIFSCSIFLVFVCLCFLFDISRAET